MITKPVCKIFNVTGVYATENKTLEQAVGLASDGDLIVLKDGLTINPTSTILSSAKNVEIFQKLETDKVQKAPGAKSLRYDDIFNINVKKSTEYKPFYALASGYTYCCDGEYGLKFEVINDELRQQMFPNGYTETYIMPADECCSACGSDKSEDNNKITLALYKKIKANKRSMLIPSMIVTTVSTYSSKVSTKKLGDTVSESDMTTILDDNSKSADTDTLWETGLLVTVAESEEHFYGQFNFKYVKQRGTQMFVTPISNMKCTGTIVTNNGGNIEAKKTLDSGITISNATTFTSSNASAYHIGQTIFLDTNERTVTAINTGTGVITVDSNVTISSKNVTTYVAEPFQLAQTDGYDLKQVEYEYMGWMGESPYRLSDVTLTEFGHQYTFKEDKTYDVFSISYEQESDAAWGHFEHPLSLILAVDSANANSAAANIAVFLGVDNSGAVVDANLNLK